MASRRVLLKSLPQASASLYRHFANQFVVRPALTTPPQRLPIQQSLLASRFFTQRRNYSSDEPSSKVYGYDKIQSLVSTPSPSRILIDVREPSEYEAGHIPTAHNLPIASRPEGIFLPGDEFETLFGFPKPSHDSEVVFYCKAGVRSNAAAKFALQAGYTNVGEYPGSWLDWVKNNGATEK